MSITDVFLPEVVLVEDTLDDEIMSLQGILRSGVPCHVTVRRDGEDALDHLLGDHESLPRLILLDLNLPKLNGIEILMRLRTHDRTRFVPVVMFSNSNTGRDLSECYKFGANSCVTKPDTAKEYVERLSGVTHYWLTMNDTPGCI